MKMFILYQLLQMRGVDDVLEALYKLVASETKVKKPTEEEEKYTYLN